MEEQPNNPLHGKRLDNIIETLLVHYQGCEGLGEPSRIRCFNENPNMKSSLAFLRKTPWAKEKVEKLYLKIQKGKQKSAANGYL